MYLGLDLGTSGLRGLLVSADGSTVGDAQANYDVAAPHAGWSEHDPADWIEACETVISELRSSYPSEVAALKGIGIAGHMHGATCLDEAGAPVRPCILWNDTRSAEEAATMDADPRFRAISGNVVFPGFTAPKLAWMREHEPDLFSRVATVLLPKDYLVYWLTGDLSSEMSDAAGTSWFDTGARDWSEVLIGASGMRRDQMPKLIEGCETVGPVRSDIADRLGLPADVRIVAGGGDNAAAACGIGALKEGQGFVSLGSSGVLLAAKDSYAPDPKTAVHTFCHAVPGRWYQMGVILSATDSLNWLAELLGRDAKALSTGLPAKAGGPARLRFLPYLSGERTPHNDAIPRGAFLGLSKTSDARSMTQAVMEGVAFALRDCLEALRSTGTQLRSVLAIGGGSNSDFWVDTLAQTLNLPVHLPEKGDFGAALGAARLAMVGTSGMPLEAAMAPPKVARTFTPNPCLRQRYEAAYQSYRKSYDAIKELT
jgi:xylulokinase